MRRDPPGEFSQAGTVSKSTTIANVPLNHKDLIIIGIYYIARDSDYWHEPEKFIPERFDP